MEIIKIGTSQNQEILKLIKLKKNRDRFWKESHTYWKKSFSEIYNQIDIPYKNIEAKLIYKLGRSVYP